VNQMIDVRDPRTGLIDTRVPRVDAGQLKALAARLRAAQANWRALPLSDRAGILLAFRDALSAHGDAIVTALEIDTGRRAIARQELAGVLAALQGWAAQSAGFGADDWVQGRSMPAIRHSAQRVPYGIVGVISPWNFPLTLSMIDTIPALLAGCAVLLKPSEVTPRFLAPLMAAVADVPALAPVFVGVSGDGVTGTALINQVDAVCFTGSVATGRKVAGRCAERLIPAFLELGGKDPLVVLDGAPMDVAVEAALRGSVLATGQACQSIERIYVPRSMQDRFVTALAGRASATPLNWPDITRGIIGPIIFDRQADILRQHLADAKAKGAMVHCGGVVESHGGGLWLAPTVLSNVDHSMLVMTEETFGPIMPVMAYDTVDQAVALANDTMYGLSAAVVGPRDAALAVAERLNAGAVSINDAALTSLFYEAEKNAFGASGLGGSRMGLAGYHRFLRRKALIENTGSPLPLGAFAEDAGAR
jgi:succinate-semialdehyde dehydrogenase / glutarate-semialdehyde dehydrogenase